jgi:hypothetical protein
MTQMDYAGGSSSADDADDADLGVLDPFSAKKKGRIRVIRVIR